MWISHFAIGFAAKKLIAPSADLGMLMFYGGLPDFLAWLLYFFGIEGFGLNKVSESKGEAAPVDFHVDYSHSLIGTIVLILVSSFWIQQRARTQQRSRSAIANRPALDNEVVAAGLLILSHFVLDLISHRKDIRMSLSPVPKPTDSYWGAGLVSHTHLSFLMELAIILGSGYLYLTNTKPRVSTGPTPDRD